jgi:hypothetical protein
MKGTPTAKQQHGKSLRNDTRLLRHERDGLRRQSGRTLDFCILASNNIQSHTTQFFTTQQHHDPATSRSSNITIQQHHDTNIIYPSKALFGTQKLGGYLATQYLVQHNLSQHIISYSKNHNEVACTIQTKHETLNKTNVAN